MTFDPTKARNYVKAVDLAGTPRGIVEMGPEDEASPVFDDAKKQAQVVGSGVFAFEKGVTTQVREAISDAALLAQLVANKKVSVVQYPLGWFNAYADVLQNVGWTLEEGAWIDYTTTGNSAQVHEKILEVATAALAPTVAALAIITASVNALKGMDPKSPWFRPRNYAPFPARAGRWTGQDHRHRPCFWSGAMQTLVILRFQRPEHFEQT